MTKLHRGGEGLELNGGPLGDLCFQWSGDRYVHHWRFHDARAAVSLKSIESDSQATWPSSPPLQQIHRQSFGDGREVVFGVGMAGRGHWSASFTLVPELSCWIVELACRASIEPEDLVSSYRLTGQWTSGEEGCFRCDRSGKPLSIEAISPSSIAELDGDQLKIRPIQVVAGPTTQWAFRLRA